ncbi:hypothetical protein D6B98_33910 [Bradyrhizobium sp. LVM 105]|nr:hypothetical protein D6B98_33910 [Bradyrhizobium sp. LVM 105]
MPAEGGAGLGCHSGARVARTRNPFIHRYCGPMDSGLSLREPRNDCLDQLPLNELYPWSSQ